MAKNEIIRRPFDKVLNDLPEVCYSRRMTDGYPVLLKRGVVGYWTVSPGLIPEDRNFELGVTVAQEQAMITGALAGFEVPGADPLNWNDPTSVSKLEALRIAQRAKYINKDFTAEMAVI